MLKRKKPNVIVHSECRMKLVKLKRDYFILELKIANEGNAANIHP